MASDKEQDAKLEQLLIAQAVTEGTLQTNTVLLKEVHTIIVGDVSSPGLMTRVRVNAAAIKRTWWIITLAVGALLSLAVRVVYYPVQARGHNDTRANQEIISIDGAGIDVPVHLGASED